jgi:DNA-directed RNA polymerase specialized sigma24 family protein
MLELSCLQAALRRDPKAVRRLIDVLTPAIQTRVASCIRASVLRERDIEREVEDMTHDVFVKLFADDAHVLRSWRPELGRSLTNFVRWQAQMLVIQRLRRSATHSERLLSHAQGDLFELTFDEPHDARDYVRRLLSWMDERMSDAQRALLRDLYIDELAVHEICRKTGWMPSHVYRGKHSLRSLAEAGRRALDGRSLGSHESRRAGASR